METTRARTARDRDDPTPTPDGRGGTTCAERIAIAAVVISFAVAAVAVLRAHWVPVADEALIEMRVRDVPAHLPLVGVWSRFGWSHPGPLQLWLLAVPYRIFGSSSALLAGTLAGHLAAILTAWWLARGIARAAGWAVLIALLAVMAGVTGGIGHGIWNPFVALVAAGTVVVAGWATAERRGWGLVALVCFGSLLVQAHVATLPLVGIVSVTALCVAVWSSREPGAAPLSRRAVGVAALVGAVLWIGPVLDQWVSAVPNASVLQMAGGGERVGLVRGIGVLTRSFAWWPTWLASDGSGSPVVDSSWTVPVWLVIPVAGFVTAVMRRDGRFVRGSIVVGASLVALVVSSALVTDDLYTYLTVADRSVAAVAVAIGLASLAQHLPDRAVRPVGIGAAATICVLAVLVGVRQVRDEDPAAPFRDGLVALTAETRRIYDPGDELLFSAPPAVLSDRLTSALMLQLEREGYDVRLVGAKARAVGEHRLAEQDWGDANVVVLTAGDLAEYRENGWTVIASYEGEPPMWVALAPRHSGSPRG